MKNLSVKFIQFILTGLLLFSCKEEKKPIHTTEKKHISPFSTGKIIDTIQLINGQSYCLYLPSTYSANKQYPIIYFFDPHANGKIALELYKDIAEEFNWIMVGSNHSQNGLPADLILQHIDNLISDTKHTLSISLSQIYAVGFSGGARIATLAAIQRQDISAVIGCGAGFPKIEVPLHQGFEYIGVIGKKDFNYIELYRLHQQLKQIAFRHKIEIFNGRHEWPDSATMRKALTCLKENCQLNGFTDTEEEKKSIILESGKQTYYQKAFTTQSLAWWEKEIKQLESASDSLQKESNGRLKEYLSFLGFIFSEQALDKNKLEEAKKMLTIYRLADQDNPDQWYLWGVYYAKTNEKNKVLLYLKSSIGLGFNNQQKVLNEKVFLKHFEKEQLIKLFNK